MTRGPIFHCTKCRKSNLETEFYERSDNIRPHSWCQPCRNEHRRKVYAEKRAQEAVMNASPAA